MEYWDPRETDEPTTPESSVRLELTRDDISGCLDLVMACGDGSANRVATLSESRQGWTATRNGLYLSYGPGETLQSAVMSVFRDEDFLRSLVAELAGDDAENEDTLQLPRSEVRNG